MESAFVDALSLEGDVFDDALNKSFGNVGGMLIRSGSAAGLGLVCLGFEAAAG